MPHSSHSAGRGRALSMRMALPVAAAFAIACKGSARQSLFSHFASARSGPDPCRYVTAEEATAYVGPLVSPPYRTAFDKGVPNASGDACMYRGRDGREILIQHSAHGGRVAGTMMRRIPTVTDRLLHNADASSGSSGQASAAGAGSAIMGSVGPGPWDNSNWLPTGTLIVYKGDDAFFVDVSASNAGKAGAVDLATRAVGRLGQPLDYDGGAAVAQAPQPVKPMPPCDLVPRARAEAILGPLAADPAPDPDGTKCTYVVGSPDGRVSYALGVAWTGGYKELNMLKHGTSMVTGMMSSTKGGQAIPGLSELQAQGGMPAMPKLDSSSQKLIGAFTQALGMPGIGQALKRGLTTDTALAGPWDAGTLVNGSWLIVTKNDVGLTMILGTADYDKAKALMAAACERL